MIGVGVGVLAYMQERSYREEIDRPLAQRTFDQIQDDAEAREQEREYRETVDRPLAKATFDQIQADAEARAWAILATRVSGNSGKIGALEYLNLVDEETGKQRISLTGIDLSCETMGGGWDAENKICETPTFLVGVNLQEADLVGANLSGAELYDANLSGAVLWSADLSGVELNDAELNDADLRGTDLSGASLVVADLSGAVLDDMELNDADLRGADLSSAVLFGSDFTDADIQFVDWSGAWAWADYRPNGLIGIQIELCDPSDRENLSTKPSSGCVLTTLTE